MKLRLEPGQYHLPPDTKRDQEFNLKQLNEAFTGPDMEAFLAEIHPKSTTQPTGQDNNNLPPSKEIESWY